MCTSLPSEICIEEGLFGTDERVRAYYCQPFPHGYHNLIRLSAVNGDQHATGGLDRNQSMHMSACSGPSSTLAMSHRVDDALKHAIIPRHRVNTPHGLCASPIYVSAAEQLMPTLGELMRDCSLCVVICEHPHTHT